MVYRVFVEKRPPFAERGRVLLRQFRDFLGVRGLRSVRVVQRYDVEGVDEALFDLAARTVFSEPPLDVLSYAMPEGDFVLAVEYLPGQFDQRADSAAECIQLISQGVRPVVHCARVYVLDGVLSAEERRAVTGFLVNPLETRLADWGAKATLAREAALPDFPPVLFRFSDIAADVDAAKSEAARAYIDRYALAMDTADVACCAAYFRSEGKDPTLTELRVLDTYWSDHCRHTTFETLIDGVRFADADADGGGAGSGEVRRAYARYLALRESLGGGKKPPSLMDIATIGARALYARGALPDWERSAEVNACSVRVELDLYRPDAAGGVERFSAPWLLMFKNETHNHPTEIEPYGGAATCLGGAIRDPLSGRAYVYQALRVSGAGNPLAAQSQTLAGKLPQRKIAQEAAAGFSAYGNQVGVATSLVAELYHDDYRAKRLEAGAVLGAAPLSRVRREEPAAGDVVVLIGGGTGRDGCGGATGSSKAHKSSSIETCGAEVQRGNPPVERKLQRLFNRDEAARLIKRCNDFGAGGIAVAVGELAAGLEIDLDAVPKKYEGLDGTELAISESQERMALVLAEGDVAAFLAYAAEENLDAAVVARVTASRRLVMKWRGRAIVDISRDFLDTNGARRHITIEAAAYPPAQAGQPAGAGLLEKLCALVQDLNVCSQRGLIERFDSTIGAGSVLLPLGGVYQKTPEDVMAALLPVSDGTGERAGWRCATASGMAFGFDPVISKQNPYEGAYLAVLASLAKLAAAGFPRERCFLSLQEYFARPGASGARWSAPFAALLGALDAQLDFGVAAIGGKDSMSGTFEGMDVPPTLVSFAVASAPAKAVRGSAFSAGGGRRVLCVMPSYTALEGGAVSLRPDPASFLQALRLVNALLAASAPAAPSPASADTPLVSAARSCGRFGLAEAVFKMCLGNRAGFLASAAFDSGRLFESAFGAFVLELAPGVTAEDALRHAAPPDDCEVSVTELGQTTADYYFAAADSSAGDGAFERVPLEQVERAWEAPLAPVYPTTPDAAPEIPLPEQAAVDGARRPPARRPPARRVPAVARPRALIPVFPGTNCESDTARALYDAGAVPEVLVLQNRKPEHIAASARLLAEKLAAAQMLILPGGFSGGDEPEGSAKLICAFFRGERVRDAVLQMLSCRDALILGICNGFQALLKLGLVPDGTIHRAPAETAPALTFNTIARHQSRMVRTRVCSTISPWFLREEEGALHYIPVSHGEGRFVASEQTLRALAERGQIATRYVDEHGHPSSAIAHNPAGSMFAVEGISSADGRVLGKMAHSERLASGLYRNMGAPAPSQKLFESGVYYFTA